MRLCAFTELHTPSHLPQVQAVALRSQHDVSGGLFLCPHMGSAPTPQPGQPLVLLEGSQLCVEADGRLEKHVALLWVFFFFSYMQLFLKQFSSYFR